MDKINVFLSFKIANSKFYVQTKHISSFKVTAQFIESKFDCINPLLLKLILQTNTSFTHRPVLNIV